MLAFDMYQERWGIETFFESLKTRGFDLANTHLREPERMERLLGLLTLALTWAQVIGQWLERRWPRRIFQGLRYTDSLLANYIGEEVILRYDPRDLTEVRVYHQHRFLCRAICPSLSTETVSLHEIKEVRSLRRKQLKEQIDQRLSLVDVLMGRSQKNATADPDEELLSEKAVKPRALKRHMNE